MLVILSLVLVSVSAAADTSVEKAPLGPDQSFPACQRFRDSPAQANCSQLIETLSNLTSFVEKYNQVKRIPILLSAREEISRFAREIIDLSLSPHMAVARSALQASKSTQKGKYSQISNGPVNYYMQTQLIPFICRTRRRILQVTVFIFRSFLNF